MDLGTGVGHPARELAGGRLCGRQKAELSRRCIAGLFFHHAVVDAAAIHTGRGSGLHASGFEAQADELFCYSVAGLFAGASTAELLLPDVHDPIHERATGEDHGPCRDRFTKTGAHASYSSIGDDDLVDAVLPEVDIGCRLKKAAPFVGEEGAVVLGARAPHRGSLAAVEHAELDRASVGDDAGVSAKRIHLANDLSFGDTAHGGVATHLPDHPHVHGDEEDHRAHVRCCRSCFVPCVASSDHDHIIDLFHGSCSTWNLPL